MRYATIAVVAVAVGFCVGSLRSNEEQVVPGSDPDHPLEVLYVRELMVVDNQGLPRIKLRQNELSTSVTLITPKTLDTGVALEAMPGGSNFVWVHGPGGRAKGAILSEEHLPYARVLGVVQKYTPPSPMK